MSKLTIDGWKPLEASDLSYIGGSKYYLDTFKAEAVKMKGVEAASNKVYLAVWNALKKNGKIGYGQGDISRAKDITIAVGLGEIRVKKSTAVESDSSLIKNASLCCTGDVGVKQYCKTCGVDVHEVGKMINIAKDDQRPIPKDHLDAIRDLRKGVYALYADEKGLVISEVIFPEKLRKHPVDTGEYTVTEQEIGLVEGSMKNHELAKLVYKDSYVKAISDFLENPVEAKEAVAAPQADFSLEQMFAPKPTVLETPSKKPLVVATPAKKKK